MSAVASLVNATAAPGRWVVACRDAGTVQTQRRFATEAEARAELAALAAECAPAWLFEDTGRPGEWINRGANYGLMPAGGEAAT